MLFRFSLYGFLKNQKYYEPFFILIFLEKGFSFFQIGLLIAFRELAVTILEVPSGALADSHGRRNCMVASMIGYIASFLFFSLSNSFLVLFFAMFLFAIGDAFRTGTHKAMIFKWLENENRLTEKTKVYGFTRSWSKTGTALSSIIAAILVYKSGSFSTVFLFCIPPYLINLFNLLSYPRDLEAEDHGVKTIKESAAMLTSVFKETFKFKPLRKLIVETMGFQGVHKVTGDYIQPLIKVLAVSVPIFAILKGDKGAAVLAGFVYFFLALLGIFGSRFSHKLVSASGSEDRSASFLWISNLICYILLIPFLFKGWFLAAILLFIVLELLQNLWRPIQIGRFDSLSSGSRRATVLSIESQAKSFSAMLYAPLLGFGVDYFGLWFVGVTGAIVTLSIMLNRFKPITAST